MKINGVLNNLYISKTYECKSHIGTRNCAEINQNDRVTFTSLKLKNGENDYSDTCFYRDLKTLSSAAIILRETFPQGTEIMDFACSNGEEAISLYSFLNDQTHNNYKIHCYDKSERAIELGRKGVYTIFKPKSFDHFLLPDYKEKNTPGEVKKLLKNIKYHFYKIMKITPEPDYEINDPEFTEFLKESPDFKIKYYELRKQFKDKFKFNVGDIKDIDKIEPEKQVGAILFRNAMYIETGNLAVNQFSLNEDLNINKKEIIDEIVDKVYDKLLPGGLFILGNEEREHLYIADNSVKEEDRVYLPKYHSYLYKKPPLMNALAKDKRFEPIAYSKVSSAVAFSEDTEVPTVWRKK